MSTLYEIGQDLDALDALLSEIGGDVSDEDVAAAVDAWLAETGGALEEKLDRYAGLIREKEHRAAARKAESDRLAQLAKVDANAVARLKERLRLFFEAHALAKVETPRFRLSLVNNGGKVPLHVLVPPETLPEEYREERTTVHARSEAIRAALEAGAVLDFAQLGERGRNLRIS